MNVTTSDLVVLVMNILADFQTKPALVVFVMNILAGFQTKPAGAAESHSSTWVDFHHFCEGLQTVNIRDFVNSNIACEDNW